MKIKIWDRLVLFFGALIVILSGAALIVVGLQITGFMVDALPLWARIVCICVGALNVFFGVYLLAFPRKFRAGRRDFVVQRTDNGELRISVKAIEGLVQKCIDMHDEIKVVSTRIRNTRDGVMVDLNIALANNISIPLAVAALQKQIKQYLAASSGIDVTEVRVSVDTAQMSIGKEKPLPPEAEEELSPAKAEEEAKEAPQEEPRPARKVPLHQRIFGRPETPAIMPEPPRPEETAAEEAAPEAAAPAAAEEASPAQSGADDAAREAPEEPAAPEEAEAAPDDAAAASESAQEAEDTEDTIHE